MYDTTIEQLRQASPSGGIFDAQNEDLKTTEKVLEELAGEAREQGTKWLAENLEVSREAVKQKRGMK